MATMLFYCNKSGTGKMGGVLTRARFTMVLSLFAGGMLLAPLTVRAQGDGVPVSVAGASVGNASQLFAPGEEGAAGQWMGVSRPAYNAQLAFATPGTVARIAVKPGARVKAGDLLMSLDTDVEDCRLALLDAEIASTVKKKTLATQIEQANLDMQRYTAAHARNAATTMEMQHATLKYSLSQLAAEEERFRVEQLRRSKAELVAQRDRMRLVAPCDGIVNDVTVECGMAVDKNTPALTLVAINPMLVELNLPIEQALKLKTGDPVEVGMPRSGQTQKGIVTQVASIAVLSNRTLQVRVSVPNPEEEPVGLMVTVTPSKN